jgi:hypothetical protein
MSDFPGSHMISLSLRIINKMKLRHFSKTKIVGLLVVGALIFGGLHIRQKILAAGPLRFRPHESTLIENVFNIAYGSAKFTAPQAPSANVLLSVTTNSQCLTRHSNNPFANSSSYTLSPGSTESIIFQFRAVDDNAIEGNHLCSISYSVSSTDPLYASGTGTATYPIEDNDAVPGFTFLKKPTSLVEGGKEVEVDYNSNDEFTHPINYTFSITSGCQLVGVNKSNGSHFWTQSFTYSYAAGASGGISVYVRAPDDTVAQGSRTCTFIGKASTEDQNYNGMSLPSLTLTVVDNDAKLPAPPPSTQPPAAVPATTEVTPNATTVGDILMSSQKGPVKLSQLIVDGKVLDSDDTVMVPQDQALELTGTTIPSGRIMLYIFSEPHTATVAADEQGNWRYRIFGLPQGEHHVEAEVTEPATGATMPRQNLLAFAITTPVTDIQIYPIARQTGRLSRLWYGLPMALILMIGAAMYWVKFHPYRKGHQQKPRHRFN